MIPPFTQRKLFVPASPCLGRNLAGVALVAFLAALPATAQVITIDTSGKNHSPATNAPVDRQFTQIEPTHVDLPNTVLDEKSRLMLIRTLDAEQGFAMRPFPRGRAGLMLQANGKLNPAGEAYLNMVVNNGLSAKPGDRVVISDIKIDHEKLIFELNGGPDLKHRILRHVSVGIGMGSPVVADDGSQATGARLTLAFNKRVPDISAAQVKALLVPLISFDVKTPIQAFTDTLPVALKEDILDHQVLVGMSIDMVVFAKGQPVTKSREMDGQMPFEEWVYGTPPEDITFVRINGNRVIRVEIAKNGKPPEIFTQDVVSPMLRGSGLPTVAVAKDNTRVVREGDVQRDPNKQAPAPPPTLGKANPDDTMGPTDASRNQTMRPVQFPTPHPDDSTTLGADPDNQQPIGPAPLPDASQSGMPNTGQTPMPGAGQPGTPGASRLN
jgi:hypothetical protein